MTQRIRKEQSRRPADKRVRRSRGEDRGRGAREERQDGIGYDGEAGQQTEYGRPYYGGERGYGHFFRAPQIGRRVPKAKA